MSVCSRCASTQFCACLCVLAAVLRSAAPEVGCCFCFRVFVALCEARLTLWGSPLGPRQSRCRIIHPGTKCVITMRKQPAPASQPRAAKAAGEVVRHSLAAVRGLNEGAHSAAVYAHSQQHNDTGARNDSRAHAVTRVCACTKCFQLSANGALRKHQLLMIDVLCNVCTRSDFREAALNKELPGTSVVTCDNKPDLLQR